MKERKSILKISIYIGIFSFILVALGLLFYFEMKKGNVRNEIEIYNLSSGSFTLLGSEDSIITIDELSLETCPEQFDTDPNQSPCIEEKEVGETFGYYQISALKPEQVYSIKSYKDEFYKLFGMSNYEGIVVTEEFKENPDFPERMYGQVLYENGDPVERGLIKVYSVEDGILEDIISLTDEYGYYSINYYPEAVNFMQKLEVSDRSGNQTDILVNSFSNKPVATIVIQTETGAEEVLSSLKQSKPYENGFSLVSKAYADGNTCFDSGDLGGLNVQCAENVHWFRKLNPNECPDKNSIRVGLVRHTSYTHLFQPANGKLELYFAELDSSGKETDNRSGFVGNGDKVSTSFFQDGVTYLLKARINNNGAITECKDIDRGQVTVKKIASDYTHGTKVIENLKKQVNVCPKIGESFAVIPGQVRTEDMIKATNRLGMKWGEVVITNAETDMAQYMDAVSRSNVVNMNLVLRICFAGNCQIKDGTLYANQVIKEYKKLVDAGKAPKDGIFIHVGHNEPNGAEEPFDPKAEAKFMNDAIGTILGSNLYSSNLTGAGIKLIGPNLNLHAGTAEKYIDDLLAGGLTTDNANKLIGWGGNTYIKDTHTEPSADVQKFVSHLKTKDVPSKIFISEMGNMNVGATQWDDLTAQIKKMFAISEVQSVLLFNSFGINPDPDFKYHEGLWNDYKSDKLEILQKIVTGTGCVTVSQEVAVEGAPINIQVETGNLMGGPVGDPFELPPVNDPVPVIPKDGNTKGIKTVDNVLGATSLKLPEIGEYTISSSKYEILRPYIARFRDDDKEVYAYLDLNKNSKKDSNEKYIDDISDLKFEKASYVNKIDLKEGHNIIAISLYPYETISADLLINIINSQGGNASAIGYLQNGVWKIFNKSGGVAYSKNFDLKTGSGIYVRSLKDSSFTIRGSAFADSVSVYIYRGWNLVGINGSNYEYTLKDVIKSISTNERMDVTTVALWDAESNKYKIFVLDENAEFGETKLKVNENDAIFVLAKQGGEYWKPS